MANILWSPNPASVEDSLLTAFQTQLSSNHGLHFNSWNELHRFSVTEIDLFWSEFAKFAGIKFSTPFKKAFIPGKPCHFRNSIWFDGARLNYAENLLEVQGSKDPIVCSFTETEKHQLSRQQLKCQVAAMTEFLKEKGIESGDRVAAIAANNQETLVCFLAAASIGAIWSSCSPDFGVEGILDRFTQINPKILFAAPHYSYNGKLFDCQSKVKQVKESLDSISSTVWLKVGYLNGENFQDIIKKNNGDSSISYQQLPFDHPLYILFSSGTTGSPKCIVHRAGGALIQHMKEHQLHLDISAKDNVFYHTTCGWMMWNWLVSALASGARVNFYDGSPVYPNHENLFELAEREEWNVFGTSASFLLSAEKNKVNTQGKLKNLRLLLSTGSPLIPEQFDFVYKKIKKDLCLSSISGGTDIVSCFALGAVTEPVRKGEIQVKGLGMDVDCFSEQGRSLIAEKGELVCKSPFPAVPLEFWNDKEGKRLASSYFERFPNVWHHGDWLEITKEGGLIIFGRSDATLNPGGVRIGTAELYRVVDSFPEIVESIAVGHQSEGSEKIVLFVVMKSGDTKGLTPKLHDEIRLKIRKEASPRHVPANIIAVPEIPRTRSGKAVEIAVRRCINGERVDNLHALANPEALKYFQDLEELKSKI
jgi:acetoacetyl-CoA synthetase